MGKLMEKAGSMTNNERLMEKGQEKREAAGYGQGGYGQDSYGQDNRDSNY